MFAKCLDFLEAANVQRNTERRHSMKKYLISKPPIVMSANSLGGFLPNATVMKKRGPESSVS
jgi:hypothetical protein